MKALYNLIKKEWNTFLNAECDGEYNFKGFYGDYEITVEKDGIKK